MEGLWPSLEMMYDQVLHNPRTRLCDVQLRTGETSAHGQQEAEVGLPHMADWPRAKYNPNTVPQAISTSMVMTGTDSSHSPRSGKVWSGVAGEEAGGEAVA